MSCIQWNDSYNIGVKQVDEQHTRLIGIMNTLCDALDNGKGNEIIGDIIREMSDYAGSHFRLEEGYFDTFHYEKTEEHKAQHQTFIQKVESLKKDVEAKKEGVLLDAVVFLGEWFTNHVLKFDREYVECFHKNGVY